MHQVCCKPFSPLPSLTVTTEWVLGVLLVQMLPASFASPTLEEVSPRATQLEGSPLLLSCLSPMRCHAVDCGMRCSDAQ